MSVCEVTTAEMYERGKAKAGGLSDQRLGTMDRGQAKCATCGCNQTECPGHFGHIELAKPVYHYGFLRTVVKVLRCVCVQCSRILIDRRDPKFVAAQRVRNPRQRLIRMAEACNKTRKVCSASDDAADDVGEDGARCVRHSVAHTILFF